MAKTATKRKPQQKEAKAPETLRGVVTKRIYYNAENGYCVLAVDINTIEADKNPFEHEDIKVTGNMPAVREGDEYEFSGNFITHPKFGLQFKFSSSKLILPSGKAGVARYLSGVAYGVGIAKATKIVEALGEDALDKIQEDPSILSTPALSFLTEAQREEIATDLGQNSVQAELAGMLCRPGSGIGMGTVSRIMAEYGPDAIRVVKDNPYVLSQDLFGIGFLKADTIAQSVGIAPDSPFRVEAALDYTLTEAGNEGHVFLQPNDIIRRLIGKKGLVEASGVEVGDVARANKKLIDEKRCIREGDAIYALALYRAECEVAGAVRRLLNGERREVAGLDAMIEDIQSRDGIEYAPEQVEAIKSALTENISIVTGGPGVGKTTVINAIVDIYKRIQPYSEVYLAAPTGRAAKRMSEATGEEAKTIHRLLRYLPETGGFYHGSLRPLPGPGLLIVDEMSMADIELSASLFSATEELQVVLVGDIDQLESVGPGSVLRDLIASGKVPTTRLKFNYRQAGGSKIAEYANLICQGEVPPLVNCGDFEHYPVEDGEQAASVVLSLVQEAADKGVSVLDWQVIAPMYKGESGVTNLNEKIKELINPSAPDKPELGSFRVGDRVLCIKNNYQLGIFNGDTGIVSSIEKGKMVVDFGERNFVDFGIEDLALLKLGFAITAHKSQGSEYKLVIAVLTRQHFIMLRNNLLYTSVTRAKERLALVADPWAVKKAVKTNLTEKRYSMLAERIKQ